MAKDSHWFCRSVHGQIAFDCNRRLFEVSWSSCHATNYHCLNHCNTATGVISAWTPGGDSIGQWVAIHLCWVRAEFTRKNGIKHTRSSPYHPASNGEVEKFVRTFKEAGRNDGLTLSHQLASFLLTYRTTLHSTTGTPPCELLMGRSLHTRWDLLKPDVRKRVWCQAKQKEQHDQHARLKLFYVGQSVMAQNFGPGSNWISGVITWQLGPLTYLVDVSNGRVWKSHFDDLKELVSDHTLPISESEFDIDVPSTSMSDHPPPEEPNDSLNNSDSSQSEAVSMLTHCMSTSDTTSPSSTSAAGAETETQSTAINSPTPPRYLSRQHQAPSWFSDTQTQWGRGIVTLIFWTIKLWTLYCACSVIHSVELNLLSSSVLFLWASIAAPYALISLICISYALNVCHDINSILPTL